MSALPSSKKTHSEKHKQILKQLLKEPANKTCADCKTATHPRWASWNLGCFICIRCSGIHRSMGTHISRVKSVDLDAWTDEQVELMVKWGNAKCNFYWELKLPENYVPDGLKIENFIRTKYDLRKWVGSQGVPDPLLIRIGEKPAGSVGVSKSQPELPKAAPEAQKTQPAPPKTVGSTQAGSRNAAQKPKPPVQSSVSLLDDDFGTFTSSPLPAPLPAPQSTQSTGGKLSERKDLKKLILSLYSLPQSSQASVDNTSNGNFHNFQATNLNNSTSSTYNGSFNSSSSFSPAPQRTQAKTDVNQMSDSLMGLSFLKPEKQWKNEWNDSSSSVNNWTSNVNSSSGSPIGATRVQNSGNYTTAKNPLDDDLFKNVWS